MKTLAVIVARLNSSRLKAKHLLPLPSNAKGGTRALIDHLLLRLEDCSEIDKISLATTDELQNIALIDWAKTRGLDYISYDGDANDVVGRMDALITRYQPEYIAYISGDCALVDPEFIDFALKKLKDTNFDSVALEDGIASLHEGLEFFSYTGWKKIVHWSQTEFEREHVGYCNKKRNVLKTLGIHDVHDFGQISHRISVDTKADYKFMHELYKRWFAENSEKSIVDLKWVQDQIINDKQLLIINQHVVQRKATQTYGGVSLFCHVGKKIGLGHFKRSELIAATITERLGLGVCLHAYRTDNVEIETNIPITFYDTTQNFEHAIRTVCSEMAIFDFNLNALENTKSYLSILEKLKMNNKIIIGIDDLYPFLDALDLLFVPSFYSKKRSKKVFWGWDSYLFTDRKLSQKKKEILVLTGGSDALDYGKVLPKHLDGHETSYRIRWVQGPLANKPVMKNGSNIEIIYDPNNLPMLLERAEIVISAYGISFYEALFRECATILLPSENLIKQDELRKLEKLGVCLIASSFQEVIHHLNELETNKNLRDRITGASKKRFQDKTGLIRLTDLINALLTKA